MPGPSSETLRDLLNLLRVSDDESARGAPEPRHDVGGPYRSERETLAAQVDDELERLEREQALLNERRALIDAVRRASRPETFPRRFFRTLAFGATLGAATSMATLFVLIAPLLGPDSRVTLRPPSEWRATAAPTPSAPPIVVPRPVARPIGPVVDCGGTDDADSAPVAHAIASGITPITSTVWDVDRTMISDAFLHGPRSVRLVNDEHLGVRVYGIRRLSTAGQLGLQNGDQLIALDGVLIGDVLDRLDSRRAVERFVARMSEHGRIELSIVRRGEPMTFTYLLR